MNVSAELNFYGDTKEVRNKLFSFKVNNENDARTGLKRFEKSGIRIRAAFFTIRKDGRIINSLRIK